MQGADGKGNEYFGGDSTVFEAPVEEEEEEQAGGDVAEEKEEEEKEEVARL